MNTNHDNQNEIDQRLLELLVDGELSEHQRREFLTSLDRTEDGWRRLALAFLEDQTVHCELGSGSYLQGSEPVPDKPARGGKTVGGRWLTRAAMAAGFLLALALGAYLSPGPSPVSPSGEVVISDGVDKPGMPDEPVAEQPAVPADADGEPADSPDAWRLVSFPVYDGSDQIETVQLPAVERNSLDEAWRMNLPVNISPEIVRAIEASGHRLRGQRRLLPLRMNDGRRLVVPVDQVELHYVGTGAYH